MEKIARKEREHLTRRKEILQAAEKVFAAKGFFHTTMNEIAQVAEFGTGTLYNFFKSKEDLYFTLIDEKTDEINRLVKTELSRKTSAIERIKKILILELEFIEQNRDFFRIYTSEGSRFEWTVKDDCGKKIHDKMVDYIQLLAQVLKEGMKTNELKPLNPLDLAHAFEGIVHSFIFEWLISPEPYPLVSKADTILEIFLKGTEKEERRN
ncbi:MAG: TetR/AcrR family transcriptional regulator [Deltaproteobacteria bacterium]|nr:TetR/AcrR family transcriptional regulator [Deltaproteobacteria bacterium]MBM4324941.1 TetR/AcrR family transcriptional regulator [Deltaproteobacteria bacterium]MBM4348250.1 TetR/AcrR family transcriptional regulator [Deltaproteobacteria bacterium]